MYRKGVSAVILNDRNEILIVNLISFKEIYFAIPGGGIEEGDKTLLDAVYREIKEELGIGKDFLKYIKESDSPLVFTFKTPKINKEGKEYYGSERHFLGFKFLGKDKGIKLKEDEVRAYKWVSIKDLDKYLLFDNQIAETLPKVLDIFPNLEK